MKSHAWILLALALVAGEAWSNPTYSVAAVNVDGAAVLHAPASRCPLNLADVNFEARYLVVECDELGALRFEPGIRSEWFAPVDPTFRGWVVRFREIGHTSELRLTGCDIFVTMPAGVTYAVFDLNCTTDRVHRDGFE